MLTKKWIDVGPVSQFPPDGAHACVKVDRYGVVVFNLGGEFHVIRNICPHAGLPLGEGDRTGDIITCPFHGYAYNIKSGQNIDWPDDEAPVQKFPTRVVNDTVQIEVEEKATP